MLRFFYSTILVFVVSAYALFADEKAPSFSKGPPFEWVKTYEPPLELDYTSSFEENVHWLLSDRQKNCEEGTTYYHYAFQLLTPQGVADHSQIEISFDPAYQKVEIHKIQVFRSGRWLDRIENSRSKIIQREVGLRNNLFDGRQTIVFFLDDIRQNDIVEYAYSIIGENPNFSSFLDEHVYLEGAKSIEKMCRRILADPERNICSKAFNTDEELETTDLSPSIREWVWEGTQLEGCPYNRDVPSWYNPFPYVQLSQYANWHEVVKQFLPFYDISKVVSEDPNPKLLRLIQQWEDETPDLASRACLALRFVQDEIRYLGFEGGTGSHKPRDPHLVFKRRFGDCKDKAFLLHYLLSLMNISSSPVRVNTKIGKNLADMLPASYLFNHVVLKIDIGGQSYWVDPTRSYQGGTLANSYFKCLHWGLVISKDSTDLTPIPEPAEKPIEIQVSYEVVSEGESIVTFRERRYGAKADQLRGRMGYRGRKKFGEKALSVLQRIYGGAKEEYPIEIEDDRVNNEYTLTQCYRIPFWNNNEEKILEVGSIIIRAYLDVYLNPESTHPYALSYPLWIQEHIHVENPYNLWEESKEEDLIEHESLYFKFSKEVHRNSADFFYELKHLKDYVPTQSLREYWNKTKRIERNAMRDLPICNASS